ncbi:hypothetical protein [Nocardia cyriacigeorgica]|uniref:hypothetical protein n=1 Tax=Nocardia cyriacigeorgica TaxID=135487 RepID=UPI0018951142|nr:hypothetical protein [Nocardia cyriacigeorgica]MBF6416930.1 hypothetical protein [Nocardia cyriacigeorgica]
MSDTTTRDQLAAIIGARRWHTNEAGGQHAATADAILAAGFRPPARVITDPAELDALPLASIGRTNGFGGDCWTRGSDMGWSTPDARRVYPSAEVLMRGPFTVLYVPTEEPRDAE